MKHYVAAWHAATYVPRKRPGWDRKCSVCGDKHFGKGLCQKHYNAARRSAEPQKHLAFAKLYRVKNRSQVMARIAAWRKANPGKAYAATRAWRAANPEGWRAQSHNRRARKRDAEGRYTADDIKKLRALQRNRCPACAASLADGYHVDHVIPLAAGGTNWPDNLQLLCAKCNSRKQAKHPVEFMRVMGFLL